MIFRAITIALFFLTLPSHASDISQATADVTPELFKGRALRKIPDLTWEETPVSVEYITIEGRRINVARFRGKAPSLSGSNIIYTIEGKLHVAKVSESDGTVEVLVPLTRNKVAARIRAIDQYGKTYDDAIEVTSTVDEKFAGKRLNFDVGLGFSYLDYSESLVRSTGTTEFKATELGLTAKAGANYQLSHRWETGTTAFITVIPLSLSVSPAGLQPARWYGLNGRVGYRFAQPNPRTSYHILAGWYFWGMLTSANSTSLVYGVERLGGPQLFLTTRSRLSNGRAVNGYLKFATIQDTGFSTSNRELAIGGAYQISKPREGARRWMLTLDIANARYSKDNAPTARIRSQSFTLNSVSLGLGTNF